MEASNTRTSKRSKPPFDAPDSKRRRRVKFSCIPTDKTVNDNVKVNAYRFSAGGGGIDNRKHNDPKTSEYRSYMKLLKEAGSGVSCQQQSEKVRNSKGVIVGSFANVVQMATPCDLKQTTSNTSKVNSSPLTLLYVKEVTPLNVVDPFAPTGILEKQSVHSISEGIFAEKRLTILNIAAKNLFLDVDDLISKGSYLIPTFLSRLGLESKSNKGGKKVLEHYYTEASDVIPSWEKQVEDMALPTWQYNTIKASSMDARRLDLFTTMNPHVDIFSATNSPLIGYPAMKKLLPQPEGLSQTNIWRYQHLSNLSIVPYETISEECTLDQQIVAYHQSRCLEFDELHDPTKAQGFGKENCIPLLLEWENADIMSKDDSCTNVDDIIESKGYHLPLAVYDPRPVALDCVPMDHFYGRNLFFFSPGKKFRMFLDNNHHHFDAAVSPSSFNNLTRNENLSNCSREHCSPNYLDLQTVGSNAGGTYSYMHDVDKVCRYVDDGTDIRKYSVGYFEFPIARDSTEYTAPSGRYTSEEETTWLF